MEKVLFYVHSKILGHAAIEPGASGPLNTIGAPCPTSLDNETENSREG
jgi:hypothetical protein